MYWDENLGISLVIEFWERLISRVSSRNENVFRLIKKGGRDDAMISEGQSSVWHKHHKISMILRRHVGKWDIAGLEGKIEGGIYM